MILIKRSTNVLDGVTVGVDGEDGEEKEEESPGGAVEEGGDGWEEAALVHPLHLPRWKRRRHKRESEGLVLGMDGRERFLVDYLLYIYIYIQL